MDKEKVTEELVRQNGNQAAAVMADYTAKGGGSDMPIGFSDLVGTKLARLIASSEGGIPDGMKLLQGTIQSTPTDQSEPVTFGYSILVRVTGGNPRVESMASDEFASFFGPTSISFADCEPLKAQDYGMSLNWQPSLSILTRFTYPYGATYYPPINDFGISGPAFGDTSNFNKGYESNSPIRQYMAWSGLWGYGFVKVKSN